MPSTSRLQIYDASPREDPRPQRNGETTFQFFNRVDGAYWEQSRAIHQEWADKLGDREYAEIRAAFRSGNSQAQSAFLELYLHQCLLGAGHEVTVHPDLPSSSKHPDFLAQRKNASVYIEAIAPSQSKSQQAQAARVSVLLAALDQIGDANFLIMTSEIVPGPSSAPASLFRQRIRAWLAKLDPDAVAPESPESFRVVKDGWTLEVEAMPKRKGHRQKGDRSIGIYAHMEAEFIDSGPKLRAALAAKDRRYGDIGAPFLIAVGTNSFDEEDEDVHNALYGSVAWVLGDLDGDTVSTTAVRKRDGYFGSPGAWLHRRVTGVLIVDQLQMHDPTRARVALWLHPDPLHPLPHEPMLPGIIREWDGGEQVVSRTGLDARTVLGLSESWPEGDPWD